MLPEETPAASTAPQEVEGDADAATGAGDETQGTPGGGNATASEEGEQRSEGKYSGCFVVAVLCFCFVRCGVVLDFLFCVVLCFCFVLLYSASCFL